MKIKAIVKQNKHGFTGRIIVYEYNRYLWSRSTNITRINKEDAYIDAVNLANDVLQENQISGIVTGRIPAN